jgi:hypothetical protein
MNRGEPVSAGSPTATIAFREVLMLEDDRTPVQFHSRILRGFILGLILGTIPLLLAARLLSNDQFSTLVSDITQPYFYLFWIGTGVFTALMVTSGFALMTVILPNIRRKSANSGEMLIPTSGDNKENKVPGGTEDHR